MSADIQKSPFRQRVRQLAHPANLRVTEGLRAALLEKPLQEAAQWMMDACRIRTTIESGAFPESGPQLIVMNSSTPLGGIATVAQIARPDLYMLGTVRQVADVINASETRMYLLYLSQQPNANRLARLRNNLHQRRVEGIDRDEAALRNVAALRAAARRVNRGGSLLFAPMGGTFFAKNDWKSGIGGLVKCIRNPDTQITFVRLYGGRSAHLLRLMNPYWFWAFQGWTDLRLRVFPPLPISEFQRRGDNAEAVSEQLRQRYIDVCGPL